MKHKGKELASFPERMRCMSLTFFNTDSELIDLPLTGRRYTWSKGLSAHCHILLCEAVVNLYHERKN
jgi:hypothetical protein